MEKRTARRSPAWWTPPTPMAAACEPLGEPMTQPAPRYPPRMPRLATIALLFAAAATCGASGVDVATGLPEPGGDDPHLEVRGITVSTPTWGWEWGTDEMARTLDVLKSDGANWVAVHPYASIHSDGGVSFRPIDPANPPAWMARPVAEAHARGLKVLVKPHLAYWGSRFSWRGDIRFDDAEASARFFREYGAWITQVAAACPDADAFVVGTELDQTLHAENEWRALIGDVRRVYAGHLTYASNWDAYDRVPFWDALDAVGIQAYFPLLRTGATPPGAVPTDAQFDAAWANVLADVRQIHARTGKPIVFTELGYDASPTAAIRPWESGRGGAGRQIQRAALAAALRNIDAEPAVRGAFLWKWFPGEAQHGDFRMSDPQVRSVIRSAWGD